MPAYVPNATQTTEPVESRTVESAALEFRTLKSSINSRIADLEAKDDLLDAEDAALQAEIDAVEVRTLALEQLAFNGATPGTVVVQRFVTDAIETAFTLGVTPVTVAAVDAYINGVYQNHDTFSVSGNVVTFSEAPAAGILELQVSVPLQIGVTTADAVEYIPAGTGAVVTTVQEKLRESVSVFNFMTAEQIADVRSNAASIDVTAAIQAALNSLPLNTASVDVLSPKGFANGGSLYFPRGRYKVTDKISLRRGVRIIGESQEATQIISFIAADSVFQYSDSGRYISDEVVFENLSIWQDPSVPATAGAAIDVIHGPASVDAIKLMVKNVYIEKTYRGIRQSAGIGCSIESVQVNSAVADGFYFIPGSEGGVTSTSTVLQNCYAFLCGASGYTFGGGAYIALVGCASDTNARYGYEFTGTLSVNLTACGAERNVLAGAKLSSCESTVAQLFIIAASGADGVVINNSRQTTLVGGYLNGTEAGATRYGINVTLAGGKITVLGTQFIGDYAAGKQCNSVSKFVNITDDFSLTGSGASNQWAIGSVQQPDTSTVFNVGGSVGATNDTALKVNYTFSYAGALRNCAEFLQPITANTAVTYPLVIGSFIANAAKGAASTITRSAGVYVQQQTQGSTANANLMIDAAAGTIPAGNWSIYSDSTRDSVFKGPVRVGSAGGTASFLTSGTGSPEGVVTAPVGSLYMRTDGGASTSLYVKETGSGNTGWMAK